jgi:uncharacterized protein (TIGR02231 family)
MSDNTNSLMGGMTQELFIHDGPDNKITEVTVFSNRALVSRQVSAPAKPGLNRFATQTKAFAVDGESVQARVFGQGEILGVQYLSEPVVSYPQQEVNDLTRQRRELKRERKRLQSRKENLQKQKQFLDSVIDFAQVQVPREVKTAFPPQERLTETLAFLNTNFDTLNQSDDKLDSQMEELDEKLSVVEKKLAQLSATQTAYRNVIEVLFQAETEQDIAMEVSYVVSNAQWHAVYKVDVPLDLSDVNLALLARVQQNSGEPWENIKLSLSNALPISSSALPELDSLYLTVRQRPLPAPASNMVLRRKVTAQDSESELLSDEAFAGEPLAAMAAPAMEAQEAQFAQAEQAELPTAFEYHYSRPVYLETNDKQSLIPLFSKQLKGEFFHYAIPEADPLVYLVCNATADSSLIEGRMNIHFAGRYIGSALLKEKKPGEQMMINLGAERGVKVSRHKIKDSLTETFFGKVDRSSVAREIEYRLVVENLKQSPEKIHLLDRIPVSKTDRFQVKGIETKPKPAEVDWKKRQGVMLWKLDLEPGGVTEISIKYFVKYPKDEIPAGLLV